MAARIYDRDRPSTLAGATAMARAAVPHVAKDGARTFAFTDIGEWLTVRAGEFLAGAASPTEPIKRKSGRTGASTHPPDLTRNTAHWRWTMSQATESNTTSTWRTALGFSLAAFVAGLTVPVLAGATPAPDADAELLRQCAECLAVDAQLKAIDEYLEVDDDTMDGLVVKWAAAVFVTMARIAHPSNNRGRQISTVPFWRRPVCSAMRRTWIFITVIETGLPGASDSGSGVQPTMARAQSQLRAVSKRQPRPGSPI